MRIFKVSALIFALSISSAFSDSENSSCSIDEGAQPLRSEIQNSFEKIAQTSRFSLPTEHVQSDAPEIVALSGEITRGLTSDEAKARAIHEWIASHIQYNFRAYELSGMELALKFPQTALDTLKRKDAVCEGYSALYAALGRAAGLQVKVVKGYGAPFVVDNMAKYAEIQRAKGNESDHAWNEVLINGRWVSVDATWDAGGRDWSSSDRYQFRFKSKSEYKFFDASPAVFGEKHFKVYEENF